MTSMATLEDIVARIGVKMEEVAEAQRRTEETQRRTEESLEQSHKRMEQSQKKLSESMEQSQKKLSESMERSQKKLSESMDQLTRRMGGIDNRLGEIVEMIIIPGVRKKMNELGYNFPVASPSKRFSKADGSHLAEVDLLLENGKEVMAVEVKTQVTEWGVNWHLDRLVKLRKNEGITGLAGKTIYAAIAGVGFDDSARALAINNGMYVIEVDEEKERIKIESPAKAGAW